MRTKNNIDLINETDVTIDIDLLNSIFGWMKEDMLFFEEDTCCLKLSRNNDIQEYNHKYRGKNDMTDVLTFPCEIKNIPFKGDIIINTEVANSQKGKYSLQKEIAILFVHGLLHLSGLDHITKKDQTRMQFFEEKYIICLAEKGL